MTDAALTSAGPRCGVHPERPARERPCERCGAFACDACFDEEPLPDALDASSGEARLCRSCRERTGRGPVPWEDLRLSLGGRLGGTIARALLHPVATFEAIGEGDLGRAASFSIVATLTGYAPVLALVALGFGLVMAFMPGTTPVAEGLPVAMLCGVLSILPAAIVAFSLFTDLVFAVVLHVTAVVLGGRGSFEGSLRGALYTSAVRVVLAPLSIFMFIPLLGPLLSLVVRVGMLVWCGFALAGTARRVHHLDPSRAALAGAAAPLAIALLFVVLMALVFVLGAATALGERI